MKLRTISAARYRVLVDTNMEDRIRQDQIESFGRLMAGFAHDMKNHLGIIRESNGLMGDILGMGALGEDARLVDRLEKSIASIERRVAVSANILHHLSGLAHRPDTPCSSFQVNDLIEEEYAFLERFSRLKQVAVEWELGKGLPALYNDPALLQHIIYRIYSQCLGVMESGHILTLITAQDGTNTLIAFRFPRTSRVEDNTFGNDILLAAITKIGGSLERVENKDDTIDIRLVLSSLVEEDTE